MTYENIEELIDDIEQYHPVYCAESIDNFVMLCRIIQDAINNKDCKQAYTEMWRLCGLFGDFTQINFTKETYQEFSKALNKAQMIESVENIFKIAKRQIEAYFCQNYITGKFNIADALDKHWMMVDWNAYWNASSENFIKGCKIANKLVGYKRDDEITAYYKEDADRHHFKDIFYSSYNGGRIIASFERMEDAIRWNYFGDANKEADGLWWSEQPAY